MRRLMGLKAEQVFEEWYADYDSHMALLTLETQLKREQDKILDKRIFRSDKSLKGSFDIKIRGKYEDKIE